jgi:uncharacterized membrane protein YkvA (DUF1232 family)
MSMLDTLRALVDPDAVRPVALRPRGRAMPYKMTIELSDRDLRHFRRELKKSRESVQIADDEEILGAAVDLVAAMHRTDLPDFVAERLEKLDTMLAMMSDPEWALEEDERSPVLAGLAYLCDPEDLIPDDIPGIGMLDDAVMIELVFVELRHELEAYQDYRAFRAELHKKPALLRRDPQKAEEKLAARRKQLMDRMRRRKKAAR